MRPEPALKGRPLAQHDAALLAREQARRAPPAVPFPSDRLAGELSARLARLNGGRAPPVEYAPGEDGSTAQTLETRVGALAANCLYACGPAGAHLVTSIGGEAVFRLVDRAFGGRGEAPDPLPRAFPLSSELLIERIEAIVAEALAAALDLPGAPPLLAVGRDASLARLAPFAPGEALEVHEFTVSDGVNRTLVLALPVGAPLAPSAADEPVRRDDGAGSANDGFAPCFADVPLTLNAVLVDMPVPLARLAALAVGDILPVAVARNVPVMIADKRIALGTVGCLDDRVAVQLTQAF
jgi:flagellar motor switch protein FliM